jgi:hypothetical protein
VNVALVFSHVRVILCEKLHGFFFLRRVIIDFHLFEKVAKIALCEHVLVDIVRLHGKVGPEIGSGCNDGPGKYSIQKHKIPYAIGMVEYSMRVLSLIEVKFVIVDAGAKVGPFGLFF